MPHRPCLDGNRNGLAVGADVSHATATAEGDTALALIDCHAPQGHRVSLAADKLLDVESIVTALRTRKVIPHIAIDDRVSKTGWLRKAAVAGRTTSHPGYAVSLKARKRIEEIFGWPRPTAALPGSRSVHLAKSKPSSPSPSPPTTSSASRNS
ncbi:MAG: hypothetical protein Q8L53_14085 [Aestuariivirga sp.]|nr:hypothetical protein [Aestuariivirga sp.]